MVRFKLIIERKIMKTQNIPMKSSLTTILGAICLTSIVSAHADPACSGIEPYVGTYKQVSATCDFIEGADTHVHKFMRVEKFQNLNNGIVSQGFWIVVAEPNDAVGMGNGDGPTTDFNDRFKCLQVGTAMRVDGSYSWSYNFSGDQLEVIGLGCTGIYTKID